MRTLHGSCCCLLPLRRRVAANAAERGPWSDACSADAIRGHVEFLAERSAGRTRGRDPRLRHRRRLRRRAVPPSRPAARRRRRRRYLQSVPLLEATPVLPGSRAPSWCATTRRTRSSTARTTCLPRISLSASSTLTAPLVFAGFGVDAPELGYNDFENIDLKGRIAVIFSGAPAKFPPSISARTTRGASASGATLIERGAVGADHRRLAGRREARAVGAQRRDELDAADALARCGRQAAATRSRS